LSFLSTFYVYKKGELLFAPLPPLFYNIKKESEGVRGEGGGNLGGGVWGDRGVGGMHCNNPPPLTPTIRLNAYNR